MKAKKPKETMLFEVDITFEFGKEPTKEIEKLEKKLGIKASHKGKLFYHYGDYDYLATYNKLEKKQTLRSLMNSQN